MSFQVGRHPVKTTTTNNGAPPLANPTRHPPPDRNISRQQRGNNFGDISSPEAGRKSSLGSQCGAAPLLSGNNNFNSAANLSWQRSVIGPAVHQHAPPPPPQRPSRLPIVSVYNPKQAMLVATALDMKAVLRPPQQQQRQQSPPLPGPLLLPRKGHTGTHSPEPPPLSPKADRHMSAASMSGGGGGAVTLSGGTAKRSTTGPLSGASVAGPLPVVTGQPWPAAAVPTAGGGGRRAMSPRRGDISRRLAAASPTFPTARRRSPSITRSVSNNLFCQKEI